MRLKVKTGIAKKDMMPYLFLIHPLENYMERQVPGH